MLDRPASGAVGIARVHSSISTRAPASNSTRSLLASLSAVEMVVRKKLNR